MTDTWVLRATDCTKVFSGPLFTRSFHSFKRVLPPAYVMEKSAVIDEFGHLEQQSSQEVERPALKLDKHGLPLIPQPSDPDDPLNWPIQQQAYIAGLIALLGFILQLGSALINPAFVLMSNSPNTTVQQASYCTTTFILSGGVVPLFIVPFANLHGRRIIQIMFVITAWRISHSFRPVISWYCCLTR
jgi:hypothetical protein